MNKSLKMLKMMCVMSLLLLIAIPLVVSSAAAEQNVCRDLPAEANPGDIITVSLDVTIDGGDRIIIDEVYPAGWTIVNAGTGDTTEAGHIKWVQISGEVSDKILTYQVQVPGSASGICTFSGEYKLSADDPTQPIDCDTQVNVVDDGGVVTPSQNVCRDLPAEANPGDVITVSLDVTLDGGDRIIIDEVYPAGWTIANAGTGNTSEAGHIKWVQFGAVSDTVLTYQVQVPGDASGTYTFSGEYDLGSGIQDIDCDTQVNVVENVVIPDEGLCLIDGWNFVSIPYTLADPCLINILCDLPVDCVMYYDPCGSGCDTDCGKWYSTMSKWYPLKGYWIHATEDCCIPAERLTPKAPSNPPALCLYEGWNGIGHCDSTDMLYAETVLNCIDSSYQYIMGPWDPAAKTYTQCGYNGETGVISGKHMGTDVFEMNPYEGYWVYVTENCTYSPIGC